MMLVHIDDSLLIIILYMIGIYLVHGWMHLFMVQVGAWLMHLLMAQVGAWLMLLFMVHIDIY